MKLKSNHFYTSLVALFPVAALFLLPAANAKPIPITFNSMTIFTPIKLSGTVFVLASTTGPKAGVWYGVSDGVDIRTGARKNGKSFQTCEVQTEEEKEKMLNTLLRLVAQLPMIESVLERGTTRPTAEQIEGVKILSAAREFLNATSDDPWYLCI